MENLGLLMVKHPAATMVVLSALVGFSVSRVYKIGLMTGQVRQAVCDEARAASEALGG